MRLDAVIFGGGAAGLWLLDRLSRDGHHVVLLEMRALGAGQTIGSQAILHVGRTSSERGLANRVVKPLRELRHLWRDALLGRIAPNLTRTRLRSECCYLWQGESLGLPVASGRSRHAARIDSETLAPEEEPGKTPRRAASEDAPDLWPVSAEHRVGCEPDALRLVRVLPPQPRSERLHRHRWLAARSLAEHPAQTPRPARPGSRTRPPTLAQLLLHRTRAVLLESRPRRGLSILTKVNHPPESRMREIRPSGSEGGEAENNRPSLPLSLVPHLSNSIA